MASKQSKSKKVALGVLTATMAVSPLASFAQGEAVQTHSKAQHQVPLVAMNGDKVAPNQNVKLQVNQDDNKFKTVRQQLENQSFGVLIVAENGEKMFLTAENGDIAYNEADGSITVTNHEDFARYTSYTATVLVKSDFQQALKGNFPTEVASADSGVSFQTGSAVGEATNVVAELEDASVRVTEVGKLAVTVTDDYGNPATDATLIVNGQGTGNDKVDSSFPAEQIIPITDGYAEVELSDQSANDVELRYEVVDNNYADGDGEEEAGTTVIEFIPGQTESIDLDMPEKIQAGQDYTITGEAEDVYGNSVEDGTEFDVVAETGTVSNEVPTVDGEFSFDYEAPTKVGTGDISVVGDDFEYVADNGVVVVPSAPANVEVTIPSTIQAGQAVPISGTVTDEFGNPIPNETVVIGGSLGGTLTTDENGQFSGTVTPGTSGTVTATIGGESVSITSPTGTPITNVTVVSSTPSKVTMNKPSTVESGKYYTVSGTLLDQNGQPIANKTITFTGSMSGTITTKADGSYSGSLRANSSGNIYAKVGTTNVPITTSTGSTISYVTVKPPAPVVGTTPKNISIRAFGYSSISIEGRVTDASGNPIPYATVTLEKSYYGDYWSYGRLQSTTTDANGNYRFTVRGNGITVFVKASNGAKSAIIPLIWGQWT